MSWTIYLLGTKENNKYIRTYCGVTTNVNRRLKQHNGILKCGAKSTRGRQWEIILTINDLDKVVAHKLEWKIKHTKNKNKNKTNIVNRKISTIREIIDIYNKSNNTYIKIFYSESLKTTVT